MTLEMFQAAKFGGSKGGPGAIWGGSRVPGIGSKEGKPEASGAKRAGNIDHTAITVNHWNAGPALTNFASIPYWRNCTFM